MGKGERKALAVAPTGFGPAVNRLFYGCNHPLAVYDLKLCLALGAQVDVTHVPVQIMPALFLLATVDDSIVSDYNELKTAIDVEFKKDVPGFWHPELFIVSSLTLGNLTPKEMRDVPETAYLYTAYEELTNEYAAARLGVDKARTPRTQTDKASKVAYQSA